MLVGKKEKAVKLTAENILNGKLRINFGKFEDEMFAMRKIMNEFATALNDWLEESEKDFFSESMKKKTRFLYRKIIRYRIMGLIEGELADEDLDEEIKNLTLEKNELEIKNEELKQENITLANELEDRQNIISSYESGSYKKE